MDEDKGYIFIIDTEQYAGNFERQLTAYITGHYGDCGVGQHEAQLFESEVGDCYDYFPNICQRTGDDDNGCFRPTEIQPTPGWFNHGMGGHFKDGQEKEALSDYARVNKEHFSNQIRNMREAKEKLLKGEKYANWTMKGIQAELTRLEKEIERSESQTKVNKFPAYCSVGIFFANKPTESEIEMMKERSYKYAANNNLTITGFRLQSEKVVKTDIPI